MASGENLDGVRRRNLSAVLRLVHRGSAPTRAELTTSTGLNRSTIGALVAELVELGLVVERDSAGARRVGRPSPAVHPGSAFAVIAVNPEVDAITASLVGLGARVGTRIRHETDHPPTPAEAVAVVADLVGRLRTGGAAQNPAVQAIAAQVFDAPVVVPAPGEYVARGAAAQAAWVLTGTRPAWALDVVAEPAVDTRRVIREQYAARA